MRLINADEFFRNYSELAVEPYINAPTVHHPNCDNCEDKALSYSMGFQDGYMTGKARPQGVWIPVSERLPEYSGLYLVSIDSLVTVAKFGGKSFMGRNASNPIEVDAWQPLPEPYKKGGEEE